MSNEGQFPIKITGDASSMVAASRETNQSLDQVKIKLSELTPAQKANAQAGDEAGSAAKEQSRQLEFLGLKTGELKKLTRELGREFPIAGTAARLMINPIVAAFSIAITVFGAAKKA